MLLNIDNELIVNLKLPMSNDLVWESQILKAIEMLNRKIVDSYETMLLDIKYGIDTTTLKEKLDVYKEQIEKCFSVLKKYGGDW